MRISLLSICQLQKKNVIKPLKMQRKWDVDKTRRLLDEDNDGDYEE